jgi:hypothetical protein
LGPLERDNLNHWTSSSECYTHHHQNPLKSATKEAGLEVNTEKNTSMLVSHYQNASQNCNIHDAANKSFKNVLAKLNYLEMTVINENYNYKESKIKLNLGNAWYHSV